MGTIPCEIIHPGTGTPGLGGGAGGFPGINGEYIRKWIVKWKWNN